MVFSYFTASPIQNIGDAPTGTKTFFSLGSTLYALAVVGANVLVYRYAAGFGAGFSAFILVETLIGTVTGVTVTIVGGNAYIASTAGAAVKIWRFDGSAGVLEYTGSSVSGGKLGTDGTEIYFSNGAGELGEIIKRNGGAWDDGFPAPATGYTVRTTGIPLGGKCYFFASLGNDIKVWEVSGAGVTVVATASGLTITGTGPSVLFDGAAYWIWKDAGGNAHLAEWTGTVLTANLVDFAVTYPGFAIVGLPLAVVGGALYAIAQDGTDALVITADPEDPTDWTEAQRTPNLDAQSAFSDYQYAPMIAAP